MERRVFLGGAVAGVAALGGSLWRRAFGGAAPVNDGPYGPLRPADGNGVRLPEGFSSRIVARSGERVAGTSYRWHPAPDGGACFADDGGGWLYACNSEVSGSGGVGVLRFTSDGRVADAYRVLDNTNRNCAGGATPWQTWLSCEEVPGGAIFETDPFGAKQPVRRPAMGIFTHEAAACDPDHKVVYLTEDEPDGNFYRYTPDDWPDLSAGRLEVLARGRDGVRWARVPDPSAERTPTRHQVEPAIRFNGGEGCYYAAGICYFTTKGDNKVWAYEAAAGTVDAVYEADSPLSGVDNITGLCAGDLFVAEDGGNMEICVITTDGEVGPLLRLPGQERSEITGPAFSPDGSRLYFSSQRGPRNSNDAGITYEVTGPFRR